MTRQHGRVALAGIALLTLMALAIGAHREKRLVSATSRDWPPFELVYRDEMDPSGGVGLPATSVERVTYRNTYDWTMVVQESSLAPREVGSTRTFKNGVFTQHFNSADLTTTDQIPDGYSVAPDKWLDSLRAATPEEHGFVKRAEAGDRATYQRVETTPCASLQIGAPPACASVDSIVETETYTYLTTISPMFPIEYTRVENGITFRHITVTSLVVAVGGSTRTLIP